MKKMKMNFDQLGEKLSKESMKTILGGTSKKGECGASKCGDYPCVDAQNNCSNCCVA